MNRRFTAFPYAAQAFIGPTMTSIPITQDQPVSHPLPADWRDLLALTKPRVMSLVVFTGLCGMLAARGHTDTRIAKILGGNFARVMTQVWG